MIKLLTQVKHNNKTYLSGEIVELAPESEQRLLELRVAELVDKASSTKQSKNK